MEPFTPNKPQKNWFRLSLRTIFVLVTILCCWLGWELSIVKQRQALLKDLRTKGGYSITTAELIRKNNPTATALANVPLRRRLLGDEAIQEIGYSWPVPTKEELARISKTFPEAKVHESQVLFEPCHPGCFPAGTLIDTDEGQRAIETLVVGDGIFAIHENGERFVVQVEKIFITDNQIWRLKTDQGELFTTKTQPLCIATDRVLQVGELKPGDTILRCKDDQIQPAQIIAIEPTERIEKVFNLILGNSEIFVAGSFMARSKPPAVKSEDVTSVEAPAPSIAATIPAETGR
jgi:hypothetical protein